MNQEQEIRMIQATDLQEQTVKAERERVFEIKSSVSADLEYIRNKLQHLYNAMMLCVDAFDDSKPENRFSLSTFAPVVAEIVEEVDETRSGLWERG